MREWFSFVVVMTVSLWILPLRAEASDSEKKTGKKAAASEKSPEKATVKTTEKASEVKLASLYGQSLGEGEGELVEGVVTEVCVKKGCWMKVKGPDQQERFVRFKDYGFFVPKTGLVGKKIKMKAVSIEKDVSIKEQKHFLADGGASPEEISKVKNDIKRKEWLASGVEVLN